MIWVLRDHITKKETIVNEKISNTFEPLLRQEMNEDGFTILMKIIQAGCYHIGGKARDLIKYIVTLKIINEGKLVEHHRRTK